VIVDYQMLSIREQREIASIVNDMPNDYNLLKEDLDGFIKVAERLSNSLATQEAYIRLIKAKMADMDKSTLRLDANQECKLRSFLLVAKVKLLSITFVNDEPAYDDDYYDEYDRDTVIKIKDVCAHEAVITTLSNQAFNICREALGEPIYLGHKRTWILR